MIVSVKGAELFYSTRGRGPVCLVLCSIGTKPFERLMPAQLSDRMQLVFIDLRGSGRSTGEPRDPRSMCWPMIWRRFALISELREWRCSGIRFWSARDRIREALAGERVACDYSRRPAER